MNGGVFSLAQSAAMVFVAAGAFLAGLAVPVAARAAEPFDLSPPEAPAAAAAPAPFSSLPQPQLPQPASAGVPMDLSSGGAAAASRAHTEAQIRRWFEQLTNPDPSTRDAARVALMGISLEELGVLRAIVDEARPVSPAQSAVLHEVVVHVYLSGAGAAGDRYPMFRRSGFLGVLLEPLQSEHGIPMRPQDIVELGQLGSGGVLIKETWPGFAGFRYLRVGDVVVGTGADRPARPPTMNELKSAVASTTPGMTLVLHVLRQGRIIEIPARVTARPAWAEDELSTRQMQHRRLTKAELYWRAAFAPLLMDGGPVS